MNPSRLSLYHRPGCSFCWFVRSAAERVGATMELRDVRENPDWHGELIAATGRATVPVLRIDHADGTTRWLPESLDIIRYLKQLAGRPDPVPAWVDRLLGPGHLLGWILVALGLAVRGSWGTAAIASGVALVAAVWARRIVAAKPSRPG